MSDRRRIILGGAAIAVTGAAGWAWRNRAGSYDAVPETQPAIVETVQNMPYREFGKTGLRISELGFGAWGIGGNSYGAADRAESLAALARAEELGCNFVDTAAVYGQSEDVLGEFLQGRRDRWVVATKFSGQDAGMTATLEAQLQRLRTDHVDFYMVHWLPRGDEAGLLDELANLKRSGKARFVGVSLYNAEEIDFVTKKTDLDGIMVPMNLLDPYPFVSQREKIARKGLGVLIRSSLKEGFLAGAFTKQTRFTDPNDQRSKWSVEEIERTVDRVEQFRFLEQQAGSMARAAIGYPLSFPEVSNVVVGVRRVWEAEENFGRTAGYRLAASELEKVGELQSQLGLKLRPSLKERIRTLLS